MTGKNKYQKYKKYHPVWQPNTIREFCLKMRRAPPSFVFNCFHAVHVAEWKTMSSCININYGISLLCLMFWDQLSCLHDDADYTRNADITKRIWSREIFFFIISYYRDPVRLDQFMYPTVFWIYQLPAVVYGHAGTACHPFGRVSCMCKLPIA